MVLGLVLVLVNIELTACYVRTVTEHLDAGDPSEISLHSISFQGAEEFG